MKLAFCSRDVEAARRDLVRICSEIREEVEAPAEVAAGGDAPDAPEADRRAASKARSTSAAPAAAGRISAHLQPS